MVNVVNLKAMLSIFKGYTYKECGKVLLYNFLLLLSFLLVVELIILFLLYNPGVLRFVPVWAKAGIRSIYIDYRNVIQISNNAQYDNELCYILKPSSRFFFNNLEFNNIYLTNSLGTRDTEDSLNNPRIIFIGDSHTMGWGVDQDDTFVKLIGKKLNKTTLNCAIASYGTVRELLLLKRAKTQNTSLLIIQYCDDDYEENLQYINNGNKLDILSKKDFDKIVKEYTERTQYYFGKYFAFRAFRLLYRKIIDPNYDDIKRGVFKQEHVQYTVTPPEAFMKILTSVIDINKFDKVIVFEINGDNRSPKIIGELDNLINNKYHQLRNKIVTVNIGKYLNSSNFYILDDHMNKSGHQVVADIITKRINILIKN